MAYVWSEVRADAGALLNALSACVERTGGGGKYRTFGGSRRVVRWMGGARISSVQRVKQRPRCRRCRRCRSSGGLHVVHMCLWCVCVCGFYLG